MGHTYTKKVPIVYLNSNKISAGFQLPLSLCPDCQVPPKLK